MESRSEEMQRRSRVLSDQQVERRSRVLSDQQVEIAERETRCNYVPSIT